MTGRIYVIYMLIFRFLNMVLEFEIIPASK